MKPTFLFDTSALIAATRFEINGQPIIEQILADCEITIPQIVKIEMVDNGLARGYRDAYLIRNYIASAAMTVVTPTPVSPHLQAILDDYQLETGDQDLIRLARQMSQYQAVVVDDRLLYIVLNRFGLTPYFLPDVLVWLVTQRYWTTKQGQNALQAITPRYRKGFISHSLAIIEERLT